MNSRWFFVLSGSLSTLYLLAPGSATVAARVPVARQAPPVAVQTAAPYRGPRSIKTLDQRGSILVAGPVGCSINGAYSFVGGGFNNVSGGYATGILSGADNASCDPYATIGAGYLNIIGGMDNNYAYNATIVAGISNGIVASAGSIIGGGLNNLITNSPSSPYYNSNLSAIGAGNANIIASPNSFIGAGYNNSITTPPFAVTDTPNAFIGAGYGNSIASDFAAILGGYGNSVTGEYATIGGGAYNRAGGGYSAIVSGSTNTTSAQYSVIAGGLNNQIKLSAANGANDSLYTAILGGSANSISAPALNGAQYSTIDGGYLNSISGSYSVIAGGHQNVASGVTSTVSGGYSNTASGQNAAIPGGGYNVAAGRDSFAAGYESHALNDGSFVWTDYEPRGNVVTSSKPGQFLARASGGFFLYSAPNLSSGVELSPGSGSWSSLSDRARKTGIKNVDDARILAKVAELPVSEWSYSAQGLGVRHIGPMAQDFRAAFGLGEDNKHISAVDEEGVALAAIKALEAANAAKDSQIAQLRKARLEDDARFVRLETRLNALEHQQTSIGVGPGRG